MLAPGGSPKRRSRSASLLAVLLLAGFPQVASGRQAHRKIEVPARAQPPVVLRLDLQPRQVGGFIWQTAVVLSDGKYVFLSTPTAGPRSLGVLMIGPAGPQVLAEPPSCENPFSNSMAIGGGLLMVNCGGGHSIDARVYSLGAGSWRTVIPNPELLRFGPLCGAGATCTASPVAIGARWIEYGIDCGYHCPGTTAFQNLQTGRLRGDPSSSTTIADLNSSRLARRVCFPLRVPKEPWWTATAPAYGSVSYVGRYAITRNDTPAQSEVAHLERCGTRLHQRLGQPNARPVANSHLIVWDTPQDRLSGLFLPSLRSFTIRVPSGIHLSLLALSSTTIYLHDTINQIWTARVPLHPPT
jgi:hypothetical protein